MDAAGARLLGQRIEQHQHWRQAASVQDGRAPAVDPDVQALTGLGEGVRFYERQRPFAKRLVDGWWRVETLEQPRI